MHELNKPSSGRMLNRHKRFKSRQPEKLYRLAVLLMLLVILVVVFWWGLSVIS